MSDYMSVLDDYVVPAYFFLNHFVMPYANFDYTHFPQVIITFTGTKATNDNFKRYLQEIRSIYDRHVAFSIVFDASQASIPGFKYQKMQADWLAENDALIREFCQETVYVIPNKIMRGVLKAIFKLQEQAASYRVVGTLEEAVAPKQKNTSLLAH